MQEGIDAIGDVIYHIETFDVTTIRASTPMFLMSRKIKVHCWLMCMSIFMSGDLEAQLSQFRSYGPASH
jgi:asparagine synthetase B (glutamine-hydrolysing)